MRAAVFHRCGLPLQIENIPDPEPGPDELILRVCACGICGTDLHWSDIDPEQSEWRPLMPGTVMGHEFAGEVVEIGREARGNWKVGDRVCAMPQLGCGSCPDCMAGRPHRCPHAETRGSAKMTGAYAEYTRIGTQETLALPDHVSYREGALVEPLAVGLHATRRAQLQAGDRVLIVGGGPVGLSIALWCRFFGARHIIVSDLAKDRAQGAARFGATDAIDASTDDVGERFRQLAGTDPTIVFDAVGVPGSMQTAIDLVPNNGRVVVVGLCMSRDVFNPAGALIKEIDITFCFVYDKSDFEFVIDMLAQGRIDATAFVTHSVGFDQFPDAFEALKTPTDQLKVMLEPG